MLDSIRDVLRFVHIPVGIAALLLMFIPLALKKGGKAHRRFGWAFVVCMGIASVTALALAIVMLLRQQRDAGHLTLAAVAGPAFLANVAILTGTSIYHGIRVLRHKARKGPNLNPVDLGLPIVLVACSIATLVLAFITRDPVLFTLPVVGLIVGAQFFIAQARRPEPMHWWFQHMAGMLGGCIAATTAALITNTRYIVPYIPAPQWLFWILPAAVGLPLLVIWQRVYKSRFAKARSARQPAPAAASAPW